MLGTHTGLVRFALVMGAMLPTEASVQRVQHDPAKGSGNAQNKQPFSGRVVLYYVCFKTCFE